MENKRRVIVTGGAGFIGSHLASRLLNEGNEVTIIDNLSTGKRENIPSGAAFLELDLGQQAAYMQMDNLLCDAVFHLAGQSSGEASFYDPLYDFRSHVLSTFWLLEWCKKKKVGRFFYASSMSIYGDAHYLPVDETHPQQPKTFYAAAKISAEAYINLYQTLGIDTTVFRLFSVYGPRQNLENRMQGMVSIFLSYMLESLPVLVKGSKKRFRDFIYIDDAVDAWLAAWDNRVSYGKVYNVASGTKTRVEDLLKALKNSIGRQDYPIVYEEGTPGDQFGIVADIAHISTDLNWKPKTDLQSGLNQMVDFERRRL